MGLIDAIIGRVAKAREPKTVKPQFRIPLDSHQTALFQGRCGYPDCGRKPWGSTQQDLLGVYRAGGYFQGRRDWWCPEHTTWGMYVDGWDREVDFFENDTRYTFKRTITR